MSELLKPLFSLLDELEQQSEIALFDIKFTQWLAKKLPESDPAQLLLSAIVSRDLTHGHVCIELSSLESRLASWPSHIVVQARQILSGFDLSLQPQPGHSLIDNMLIGDGSVITPIKQIVI